MHMHNMNTIITSIPTVFMFCNLPGKYVKVSKVCITIQILTRNENPETVKP